VLRFSMSKRLSSDRFASQRFSRLLLLMAGAGCAASPVAAVEPSTVAQNAASATAGSKPAAAEGRLSSASAAAAPDFELDALSGDSLRLSQELGQVVLLDFWATYCEPCLRAMPHLNELFQRHGEQGFQIWAISIDGPDSIAQVRAQVSKQGLKFPVLLDQDSRVVALYNPKTSAPFSVLIGRDGRVLKQYEGYSATTGSSLETDVVQALGKAAANP
jgi:peroxiredoxin